MAFDLTRDQLQIAQIYQIIFSTGTIMYFTDYGGIYKKLPSVGGNVYTFINIKRTKIKKYTDMQVDVVDVSFPVKAFTVDAKTILEAIELKWFDNAEIIISQVNPKLVSETREVFRGKVSKGIEFDRGVVSLSITSMLDLLKKEVPRFVYQEQCNHKLFDTYCTLTKSNFEETGNIDAGSTTARIYDAVFLFSNQVEGYWVLGKIQMTSGDNSGKSRAIRSHSDGYIDFYTPFDFDISIGDTFKAYPGCNKNGTTCDAKFSNIINFSGFEFIPRPEILY